MRGDGRGAEDHHRGGPLDRGDHRRVARVAGEDDRGVGAAERRAALEREADARLARDGVGDEVGRTMAARSGEAERGREEAARHRQDRGDDLEDARGAEGVAEVALERADGEALGVRAEDALEGAPLGEIVGLRPGAVGVEVADLRGRDAGVVERGAEGAGDAEAGGIGRGRVVSVGRGAHAEQRREGPARAALGVVEALEHEEARALADAHPHRQAEGAHGAGLIAPMA